MNILYIVPYVPSPVRVRPYNLIRSLSKQGHRITLATLISNPVELGELNNLQPYCEQVISVWLPAWRSLFNSLGVFPTSRPLQSNYCWQPSLIQKIIQQIEHSTKSQEFDLVHVEHLRGARFGLRMKDVLLESDKQVPIVWDSVDCISHLFRQTRTQSKKSIHRWLSRFELNRTEKYEGWLVNQFEAVLVTSPVDKDAYLALSKKNNQPPLIHVLSNGVDLDYFHPVDQPREDKSLIITGKMSYHANITMTLSLVEEIMPLIWKRKPGVRVVVAGKNPPREILALSKNSSIQVTGTVKNMAQILQKSTIAVAPIKYGAGIQNKVLEAMATATPVVTTPQGVSALSAQPDRDLLIGSDAQDFAEKVLFLLDHPQEQQKIGWAGRRYVEANHHWDSITNQLESIYYEAINHREV